MFFTFPLIVITKILQMYVGFSSGVGSGIPTWVSDGFTTLFSGGSYANSFLPIYPHPEMVGMVHTVGIMTIVGFLALTMQILIVVGVLIVIIMKLIQLIPYDTSA